MLDWRQKRSGALPCWQHLEPDEAGLAAIYTEFAGQEETVLGHLGQSLDGYIATASGHAANLTGPENHDHIHRLRALADAIVVGAGTVAADNPRLTTRRVVGPSPVRVVLDQRARLDSERTLFRDGAAATLVFSEFEGKNPGAAERLVLKPFSMQAVLRELGRRGLKRIFVEGGGITVSRLMAQGLLDRLQICVAPILLGRGIRGLDLAACGTTADGLLFGRRPIVQGRDRLFDSGVIRCIGQWPSLEIVAAPNTFGPMRRLLGDNH